MYMYQVYTWIFCANDTNDKCNVNNMAKSNSFSLSECSKVKSIDTHNVIITFLERLIKACKMLLPNLEICMHFYIIKGCEINNFNTKNVNRLTFLFYPKHNKNKDPHFQKFIQKILSVILVSVMYTYKHKRI